MDKRLYDLVWGTTLRTTTALHRVVHKVSGGRVWRRFPGGGVIVWITTLGRKSGEWRTNPLLSVQVDGDWIITGVKGEHYPCKPDIFAMTYEVDE